MPHGYGPISAFASSARTSLLIALLDEHPNGVTLFEMCRKLHRSLRVLDVQHALRNLDWLGLVRRHGLLWFPIDAATWNRIALVYEGKLAKL